MAVLHRTENNQLDICQNRRVGTKRYMAPELLDETMCETSFDAFRHADMYCFGLVLWEIACRMVIHGASNIFFCISLSFTIWSCTKFSLKSRVQNDDNCTHAPPHLLPLINAMSFISLSLLVYCSIWVF